jgi:uncharacterized protein YbaA (DUF1428 family)
MAYVDGFVVPVPKKHMKAYLAMARKAKKVWRDHGALEYRECTGEDIGVKKGIADFPRMMKLKAGETVIFSWITYKSKAHRDSVNKKVMKDPRLDSMMNPKSMPFDVKRMVYGGFKVVVSE